MMKTLRRRRLIMGLFAGLLTLWVSGCCCDKGIECLVEDYDDPAEHVIRIEDSSMNPGKNKVIVEPDEGNTLKAKIGDSVTWKNVAGRDVTIEFAIDKPLFGVDKVLLHDGESVTYTIVNDAWFASPKGFAHVPLVQDEDDVGGSNIIVCPPPPLPCD